MIKQGIHKAETGFDPKDPDSSSDEADDTTAVDGSNLTPNRTFYILRHNLFSKEISVIDITSSLHVAYTGGEITDELRDAARALSENKTLAANPIYRFKAKHWWSSERSMIDAASGSELATWKHGGMSFSPATLSFPAKSPHSSHPLIMQNLKWSRTNEWVRDSITYAWRCDSKKKANRMTLVKTVGAKQLVAARYVQRWGSWITGGVLLVDGREEDEVVACLSACVMLRRMQQRAAERAQVTSGGGGGGGGE